MSEHAHSSHFQPWQSPKVKAQPVFLLAAFVIAIFGPSRLAAAEFTELLSGKDVPLSLKLNEFDENWRCVSIHGGASVSGNISLNISGNTASSVSQNNNLLGTPGGSRSYVTKGQTVSASGQEFLVAYYLPSAGLDLGALLQAAITKTPPIGIVLTPETALQLCLLEVRAITSLENVRPFDMKQVIDASEQAAKALANLVKQQEESAKPAGKVSQPQPTASPTAK